MMIMNIHKSHIHDTLLLSAVERNIKRACVSMLLCVTSKYALFQKVCVKIASSIMPGVKMLRQNFVSASNKSPKDKRLRPLKIFPIFFQVFSKRVFVYITKEGAGFLPDDTLSHVKKTNLLSRCNRCTTLSNLKKEKEMNNQIHLRFLLKQPQCKVINSFYCSQLDCDKFLR